MAVKRSDRPGGAALVVLAALLSGCLEPDVTDPKIRDAIKEVNGAFGIAYQKMLHELGSRRYPLDQASACRAMERVLTSMGFRIQRREGDYFLHVVAPAPLPLNSAEWALARSLDEPALRTIAIRHVGFKGNLAKLQPDGLEVNGYLTLLPVADGVEISITMRMLETKPAAANSILPRREYPPPHAAQIGFEKIWQRFGSETSVLAHTGMPR